MGLHSEEISITVDASGDATVYSSGVSGRIHRIKIAPGTLTSGAVNFTVTSETHGDSILALTDLSADQDKYPRVIVSNNAGVALTAYDHFIIQSDDRVKVVVDDGGNALTGSVTIFYEA